MPFSGQYASLDVKKAADSLKRAEQLSAEREAPADIDSAAYIASTQARTAMAIAKAASEEEAIKTAEADRERARADANARRASDAQAQAAIQKLNGSSVGNRQIVVNVARPMEKRDSRGGGGGGGGYGGGRGGGGGRNSGRW